MSRGLVIGDPHADNKNLDKIGELLDMAEEIYFEQKLDFIALLGDLLDTKEIIRGITLNFIYERLERSKAKWIILVGNHDWFNHDCLDHSLQILKKLPNVTIVDCPTVIDDMLFMPYYDDIPAFKKALANPAFQNIKTLFMHQGIIGFDYGNGYVADGNGHGEMEFTATVRFVRVISGHFHKFAQQGNLTFLGTSFTTDFGEVDQIKYIGIYDSETDKLELFETPFPRHRDAHIDVEKFSEQWAEHQEMGAGDIWRVFLKGTEIQIAAFDKSKYPGVKFIDEPTDADQIENSTIKDTDSNEQKFLTWAKDLKGLDDETIAEGLDILKAS